MNPFMMCEDAAVNFACSFAVSFKSPASMDGSGMSFISFAILPMLRDDERDDMSMPLKLPASKPAADPPDDDEPMLLESASFSASWSTVNSDFISKFEFFFRDLKLFPVNTSVFGCASCCFTMEDFAASSIRWFTRSWRYAIPSLSEVAVAVSRAFTTPTTFIVKPFLTTFLI